MLSLYKATLRAKFTVLLLVFILLVTKEGSSQNETVLLVIPSHDATVILDGVNKGDAKANSAFRITTHGGDHYLEVEALIAGVSQNKGELVNLEPGQQRILKIDFTVSLRPIVPGFISVAELNFDLPGSVGVIAWQSEHEGQNYPYPEFYYAFEKGDEILLNLTMSNLKGTNVINVSTYPDGVERYTNNAFTELEDLVIKVPERAIYRFAFATNHAFPRNAFLKVSRKPASSLASNFNTKVTYKRSLTPVSVIDQQSFFVNSGSNATFMGGKSRITVPVKLPGNTIEWFYRFSASREASDIENVKNNFGLFGEVTKLLLNLSGVGVAINTLAVEKLSQPPGANYCDIYFIEYDDIKPFEAKTEFQYYLEGSRQNFKSGNVKVSCCNSGMYYLGIKNPDSSYGINVSIEVVAITAQDGYVMTDQ